MDFTKLIFHHSETQANGAITLIYLQKSDVTKDVKWSVPPQVDLSSYGFVIPAFELAQIEAARLNYVPPIEET